MHSNRTAVATLTLLAATALNAAEPVGIRLDLAAPGHAIPKTLYGIFFEDINCACDGGIYPERIANRGFDWDTRELEAWTPDFRGGAMARITRQFGRPVHEATARHLRIETFGPGTGCGIRNDGFGGIAVQAGAKYDLSFYARGLDGYAGGLRVVLEDSQTNLLASFELRNTDFSLAPRDPGRLEGYTLPAWKRHAAVLTPTATARDAHLSILMDAPGAIELEQVSLFPQDTFNRRPNGLRPDLVQLLKDMKPGIMRFPGGCLTEGHDFASWYDWKRSVGDGSLESRRTEWNTWGYWQTFGLGYFEYFCLCEDIGCEPLPVMGSGLTCQFAHSKCAPLASMEYFAENLCDLIEFANGDPSTKWGALRAKMGHPKSFNLKYLGIGNENWDHPFLDRYLAISKILRAKHPEIRLVSSAGAGPDGGNFDLAWRTLNPANADVVDEHYYVSPQWLLTHTDRYDARDRAASKVYAGEYACHLPNRANSLYSALCEAAMMTGFERDSDVVEMTSYAPLWQKIGWNGWKPDLIWYDNERSFGTPNYYVQKLFSLNRPTRLVPSACNAKPLPAPATGGIALQTYHSAAEFADVRVTAADGRVLFAPKPGDLAAWNPEKRRGTWTSRDGALVQTDAGIENSCLAAGDPGWSDYTLTLRARQISGKEGFLIRFRDGINSSCRLNLGGWDNTRHGIECGEGSLVPGTERPGRIEPGRWHDVKLTLSGDRVSAWLDNKPLYENVQIPAPVLPDFFTVSGYDEAAGELVVKCVNVANASRDVSVSLSGASIPAQQAKRIQLAGAPDVVNDIDHPTRCAPAEDVIAVPAGTSFRAALAPSSLSIFRLKISK